MRKPVRHFFVCGNRRPAAAELASCGHNGSTEVASALRRARERHGLSAAVYVTDTGCLGLCPPSGCTIVVYPEAVWYTGVTTADVDEIVDRHMLCGEVVERLLEPTLR